MEELGAAGAVEPPELLGITNEGIDLGFRALEEPVDEVATEKAGAARDKRFHSVDFMKKERIGQWRGSAVKRRPEMRGTPF